MKQRICSRINGEMTEFVCQTGDTLLHALRDTLLLTGTKDGCGSGDCGACSVMLNGRLVCSCLVLAVEAQDSRVETVEGLASGEQLHPLQQAFLQHSAVQCGICTPGFLIAANALLEVNPSPTESEVRSWIAGNLCRCTGYDSIVRAILAAARAPASAASPDWLGKNPEGLNKVTGRSVFSSDFRVPDALHSAVLRSPYTHARILRIDTSKAMALPGVKAVVTSADMPVINSQPPDFRDMSATILARDKVFYQGHAIAAVAAVDAATAAAAVQIIDIEYEVLPHVIDVQQAMEPDAPVLHDTLYTQGISPAPSRPSNIASRYEQAHGDVDQGFAGADIILTEEFTTQAVQQASIEPEACMARVTRDGRIEIWCGSRDPVMVRDQCARLLDLPLAQIHVEALGTRGDGGDRTAVQLEPLAVLLARKSGRPVSMQMSRAEMFKATGSAPGAYISMKIGARKDGTVVAVQGILCFEVGGFQAGGGQAGASAGSPGRPGCMTVWAPYHVNNVRMIAYDVVVNRPPSAADCAPITSFAAESLLDMLAQRLGMDPVELRLKNAARQHDTQKETDKADGPRISGTSYVETLEAVINHPHYSAPLGENQGRGVACGYWFNSAAFATHICDVEVDPDTGRVRVGRYTIIQAVTQDAGGQVLYPPCAEGQLQGGVAQGIGWALNEASLYDENGAMLNPGFLDYRIALASDLPMIDTVLVEVPAPDYPLPDRDGLEVAITPSLGAVANAVARASGARLYDLPMSPPAVLKAAQRAARKRR